MCVHSPSQELFPEAVQSPAPDSPEEEAARALLQRLSFDVRGKLAASAASAGAQGAAGGEWVLSTNPLGENPLTRRAPTRTHTLWPRNLFTSTLIESNARPGDSIVL